MLVAFSVAPSGDPANGQAPGDASVHDAVAAAVRIVRESGLPNRTSSMFTEIEGEWDEVMDVVKRATDAVGAYGSRVSLVLKADIRPGYSGELTGKVERLESAIGAAGDRRPRLAGEATGGRETDGRPEATAGRGRLEHWGHDRASVHPRLGRRRELPLRSRGPPGQLHSSAP